MAVAWEGLFTGVVQKMRHIYFDGCPVLIEKGGVAEVFHFRLQPIMSLQDRTIFAHEVLYRGRHPNAWIDVDMVVLDFLAAAAPRPGRLFINLSHQSLISIDSQRFLDVTTRQEVYFELNEGMVDEATFHQIATKVNVLSAHGVNFAIDDFGSGHDGLKRIYALDNVAAIKVDRELLAAAFVRQHAADHLRALVDGWNKSSIITIAEGVETESLLVFAKQLGFQMVQGFHVDTLV